MVLLAMLGFYIFDEGFSDLGALGLLSAFTAICFAVGYTTSRKRL
jgi:hypothetical protein